MPFKFETKTRVRVPGQNAEAVVMDATETIPGYPVYTLKYLSDAGENECGTIGEGDLAKVNPTQADEQAEIEFHNKEQARFEQCVLTEVNRRLAAARRTRAEIAKKLAAKRRR